MVSMIVRVLSIVIGVAFLGASLAAKATLSCEHALEGKVELSVAEKVQYLREANKNLPNEAFGIQSMVWLQDPYQPFLVRKEIFDQLKSISMQNALENAFQYFSATEKVELIRDIMRTELPAFNFPYHSALQFFTMDSTLPLFIRLETFQKLLSIRKELPVMEMLKSFEGGSINPAVDVLIKRNTWDVMESYRFEESVLELIENIDIRLDSRQVLLARYLDRFEDSSKIRRTSFSEREWKQVFQFLYSQHRSKMSAKGTLALDKLSVRINSKPVWQKLYEQFFARPN